MIDYSKGDVVLARLFDEHEKRFGHPAYAEVEWNIKLFEVDVFSYYIRKCLETDTI